MGGIYWEHLYGRGILETDNKEVMLQVTDNCNVWRDYGWIRVAQSIREAGAKAPGNPREDDVSHQRCSTKWLFTAIMQPISPSVFGKAGLKWTSFVRRCSAQPSQQCRVKSFETKLSLSLWLQYISNLLGMWYLRHRTLIEDVADLAALVDENDFEDDQDTWMLSFRQ